KKLQEEKKFNTPKKAKDKDYLHSNESKRNLKLYKNDSVRIRARYEGKVPVFTMSQGTGPTSPNRGMEAGPSGSSGPTTRSKKKNNTSINDDSQASPSFLDAHDKGDLWPWVLEIKHYTYKFLSEKIFEQVRANPDILVKAIQDQLQRELEVRISMSKAFKAKAKAKKEIRGDHILQYSMLRDYVFELQSTNPNTTVKIVVERNTDPSLPTRVFQRIYVCLGALKLGFRAYRKDLLGLDGAFMKGPFLGQVLVVVGLNSNNRIYPLPMHWLKLNVRVYGAGSCRAKSDLLLNNMCEVFNGKIVGGVIDKCNGPLTPTATRIMKSIKKEAHFIKVQWNGANKYQVSGSLGDEYVVDVVSMTCSGRKWELTRIPYKHVVAACWNMALNDRAAPPPETWVNPCYWLSTWKETYSHKIQPICGTKYWEKSICPTTLLPPKHHVQVATTQKPVVVHLGKHNKQNLQLVKMVQVDQFSSAVSETRNADGREMDDGVPTQSSAASGASEWSFQ
ncbi:hypothetical protein Tco_0665919, partial [Tanacetum coccineum]